MAEGGEKSLEEIMKQVEDLELLAKRKEKLVNQRRQESRPLFSSVYSSKLSALCFDFCIILNFYSTHCKCENVVIFLIYCPVSAPVVLQL